MSYSVHRGAEADLLEAARFYRREGGPRLAGRFLDEYERVGKLIQKYPGIGTPTADGRRVHTFQDFPYSVIYRKVDPNGVRILIIRHERRDPQHGEERW